MRNDLKKLMQAANLDALLITGPAQHNPPMTYFTGLVHVTSANLIYPLEAEPVLFFNSMERDGAAATGFKLKNYEDYDTRTLLKESGGDFIKAQALRYKRMLTEYNIQGRVGVYGRVELGENFAVLRELQKILPEIELVGESNFSSVLIKARTTKDAAEIDQIQQMGKITVEVFGRVQELLAGSTVHAEKLLQADGNPLTIADVKQKINFWLAEMGAENPEGTIFAQGRDAGVPHNNGTDTDILQLGKSIIFDLFPCQAGGGYFYDCTRTWCLGYAPDEVLAIYENVSEVYDKLYQALKLDAPFRDYQQMTCKLFEAQGHATIQQDPKLEAGYVHSLGHGVGLDVHETPYAKDDDSNTDLLLAGSVFAIEPGLYYPEKGYGVRLEDTLAARADGSFEILADFPKDLIVKMKA